MKVFFSLLLLLSIFWAKATSDSLAVRARLQKDVYTLAADSMGGRAPGTLFETKAADYIMSRFTAMGIKAKPLKFDITVAKDSALHCLNVAGFINNKADSTIIIGAHYDHLGSGTNKSRELFKKGIHHGADDNASGVALMLELAHELAAQKLSGKKQRYNYIFVGFSAHEMGLYGSYNFIQKVLLDKLAIKLFVNFDMVGRLDPTQQKIRISYCAEHDEEKKMFAQDSASTLQVAFTDDRETVNDYTLFCEHCIPAVSITTGLHDDYHRLSDTPDKINFAGMQMILDLLKKRLQALNNK